VQQDSIPFVHLGARSEVSLGESIARVEELCWEAARDNQGYLALTDVNSLARSPRFSVEAARAGLQPLHGAELNVLPLGETQFRGVVHRVRILVFHEHGWRTLLRLVNQARQMEAPQRPAYVNFARLLEDPRGLFLFLGGERGQLTQLIQSGEFERAEALVESARESYGTSQLALELPPGALERDPAELKAIQAVADYFGLATVVVPEIRAAHAADDPLQRLLHERFPKPPTSTTRLRELVRPQSERPYLQPRSMVAHAWKEFPAALARTLEIA
jgi:DNA polymerase III alpha subunit